MRRIGFILTIVIASALLAPGVSLGQPTVPPVQEIEQRFQAAAPPAQAEIVFLVLEFAPGVWLPLHTHSGPGYATVLDGTMTRRAPGSERSIGVGDGWVDPSDVPHQAGNDGLAPARIVATFVIPKGGVLTTPLEAPDPASPGATTLAEQHVDILTLPSPLDIVHRLLEVAPGAEMPAHRHPGLTVVSILGGNGTLLDVDRGVSRALSPGVTWVDEPDYVHGGALVATAPVLVVVSHLLPRGAPHTVSLEIPSPARGPAPVQLPRDR